MSNDGYKVFNIRNHPELQELMQAGTVIEDRDGAIYTVFHTDVNGIYLLVGNEFHGHFFCRWSTIHNIFKRLRILAK
jgi:hypothetical protein